MRYGVSGVVGPFKGEFINQNTLNWIGRGVTEIYDLLLKGDMERGYFSYLFDEKRWMFPEGISFVFGE